MNGRQTALTLVLLVALSVRAADAPKTNNFSYRWPHRYANGAVYDLTPHFNWWKSVSASSTADLPAIPAPFPAWHRIKHGLFVKEETLGWLLDAEVESTPGHGDHEKVILRSPPTAERDKWRDLSDQLRALESDQQSAQAAAKAATNGNYNVRNRFARAQRAAAAQNQQQSSTARASDDAAAIRKLRDQMAAYPHDGTNYLVDLFALKIGYKPGTAIPVYEVGYLRP